MRMNHIINPSEQSKRQGLGEVLRFGIVGLSATAIQYTAYWVGLQFTNHNLAMTVAYLLSFAFNLWASLRYTFRVGGTPGRGAGFAMAHVVNYLLQMATLNLFVDLGVSKTLAPLPMFAVCVPINFLLVRFFLKRNGIRMFGIFKVRREEWMVGAPLLTVFVGLHALLIARYYQLFTPLQTHYWDLIIRNFHLSGFDPITYVVVSDWQAGYNVFRHPLLAFFMYVPYMVNQGLMWLTGINCAIFVVAAMQVFAAFYSLVFLHRLLLQVMGLNLFDTRLLSLFFFSLAYVMLSAIAPDHFILSLFALLLTLLVAANHQQRYTAMPTWKALCLFVLTAGISLNNGLKVFVAALFTNGRRFFRPRFLFFAVLLPSALIWAFARFEYKRFVWPDEVKRHQARDKRKAAAKKKAEEEARKRQLAWEEAVNDAKKKNPHNPKLPLRPTNTTAKKSPNNGAAAKMGKPMMQGEFMRWTDISTSRLQSSIENLFGESIQLHRDHLLEDMYRRRPVIVHYRWAINYVAEGLLVLLFVIGLWVGRRNKLLLMALAFAAMDWVLHVGLGFGLNEVYIMTVHWAYVLPLGLAALLLTATGRKRSLLRIAIGSLTLWLYAWNLYSMVDYLLNS